MNAKEVNTALSQNLCNTNPIKPKSAEEIYSELAKSRDCYAQGEYEDFDIALDDISKRYGL